MTTGTVTLRYRLLRLLLLHTVATTGWCQMLLDPEPRNCRTKDTTVTAINATADKYQEHRNEYPAGGVLMVLAKLPAGLFGSLQVYLCPDGEAEEECFDRVPLQLSDGSGTSYDLHKVPGSDKYEIPVILPDNVTCQTCTLQVRVLKRDCEEESACPAKEEITCADITIREIKYPEERVFRSILKSFVKSVPRLSKIKNRVSKGKSRASKARNYYNRGRRYGSRARRARDHYNSAKNFDYSG